MTEIIVGSKMRTAEQPGKINKNHTEYRVKIYFSFLKENFFFREKMRAAHPPLQTIRAIIGIKFKMPAKNRRLLTDAQ